MTEPTEESSIYFQSLGALTGQYLPSEDDISVGTLMTSRGIFPAILMPDLKHFIENFSWTTKKRLKYICWLKQVDTEPYYKLKLFRSPKKKYPYWIKESGWFRFQGVIEEVKGKEVVLFVRRNYLSSLNKEQIENSRTYIRIDNCPKEIRKGQFWHIEAMLESGKLNYLNSHRLADARETKKLLAHREEMFFQSKRKVESDIEQSKN